MKIYVTKYALTAGIKEHDAEINGSMATVKVPGRVSSNYHWNDWHRTPEEAAKRAEEMRIAKISSLCKQITKLQTMKF